MLLALQDSVVALQVVAVAAKLVETGGLDEHAGVGAREPRDGEGSDDRGGYEDVGVMKRDGKLAHGTGLIPADQDDVIPLLQMKAFRDQTPKSGSWIGRFRTISGPDGAEGFRGGK